MRKIAIVRAIERRKRGRRSESGELLIESLISAGIMGMLFVAVMAAFGTLFVSAGLNQRIARASNEATSVTEALERVAYVPCAGPSTYLQPVDVGGADVNPVNAAIARLEGRYTLAITNVEYLSDAASKTATFQSTCPGAGDQGVQRMHIKVTSLNTEHQTSTVIIFTKRDATCPEPALRPAEIVDGQPC